MLFRSQDLIILRQLQPLTAWASSAGVSQGGELAAWLEAVASHNQRQEDFPQEEFHGLIRGELVLDQVEPILDAAERWRQLLADRSELQGPAVSLLATNQASISQIQMFLKHQLNPSLAQLLEDEELMLAGINQQELQRLIESIQAAARSYQDIKNGLNACGLRPDITPQKQIGRAHV